MSGHTPGPWKVFNKGSGLPFSGKRTLAVMKDGREIVSWMGFDGSDYQKQAVANAKLIASAPELAAENKELRAQAEALAEALGYCTCEDGSATLVSECEKQDCESCRALSAYGSGK